MNEVVVVQTTLVIYFDYISDAKTLKRPFNKNAFNIWFYFFMAICSTDSHTRSGQRLAVNQKLQIALMRVERDKRKREMTPRKRVREVTHESPTT
jgi:hypothetical protein